MLDTRGIGDVAEHPAHIRSDTSQSFDGGDERVLFDISQHYVHARLCEGAPEREANSAGPACHERCLSGELPHDACYSCARHACKASRHSKNPLAARERLSILTRRYSHRANKQSSSKCSIARTPKPPGSPALPP